MNNIKGYKLFESVKSFSDYELTPRLYSVYQDTYMTLDKFYAKNTDEKLWNICESMESYLQEYIDDDRLKIDLVSIFNHSKPHYSMIYEINAIGELISKEAASDISQIFDKLSMCIDLIPERDINISMTRFEIPSVIMKINLIDE